MSHPPEPQSSQPPAKRRRSWLPFLALPLLCCSVILCLTFLPDALLLVPAAPQGSLPYGDRLEVAVLNGVAAHEWTFEGEAGQQVSIVSNYWGGFHNMRLYAPDGTELVAHSIGEDSTGNTTITTTLPASGVYRLRVELWRGVKGQLLDNNRYSLIIQ